MTRQLVWHLVPMDLARGAQVYAGALRDALDSDTTEHRIVTLFRSPQAVLQPEHALDVPMQPLRRLGFDPRVVLRLRRLLRRRRPDFAIAHGSEPLKYALAARVGCPIAAYRIGVSTLRPGLRQKLFGRQLQRADHVAGVSQEVLDESVRRFGVRPDRCVLIPNGRDPAVFHPAEAPPTPPRVLFVGHFDANKRPGLFLDTIGWLRAHTAVRFDAAMIGEGALLEGLRERAAGLGVELLGRRGDVPHQLRASSVLLATSEAEGLPGVFLEAGLTGVPVVTTPVPGALDVIEDGRSGRITRSDAPEELGRAVLELLENPVTRDAMGDAARQRCLEDFTIETGLERWRELLRGYGLG